MRLFLGGVELFDKSRGGDETRHRYLTHSEWHTDSKFVGLLKVGYRNGTCVKPKVQSGASYIPTVIRRSYVYGTLKRIAGYGLNAAQMQLTAGRHLIMELKAAGWIGIKQMIWGAGQHILDKETRCALVRFIDIMEQRHHIE